MGRIVGIDLGTTYSAVAIPEERAGDGFFVTAECPGYSVIMDKFKRRITPSVVAEDNKGEIMVGYSAKGRAGFSPEPIMFAKRWMGEDKTFQLDKLGVLNPEQVSSHVLRFLKEIAEERLGEPVTEAVITVPAYFSLRAKQMTEEAGRLAGLQIAQLAQEPVAAALMYCLSDPREQLKVMTYDLGGGTFDVAILERRDATISTDSVLAFDGDRFLGGYDFDKSLALWLMDQLNELGHDLRLNFENPADRIIFAKLMIYAERAKINLSKSDSCELQEPSTGITDHAGNPVAIELVLTRDKFESMIAEKVDYTISLCQRALERANLTADQLDEILMVGGSSRIPLVARRLEEAFGRKPKLVEPDLCVALGAAVLAGTKPKTIGCVKMDPLPAETELEKLTVSGHVVPDGSLQDVTGCAVTVRATDGSYRSSRTVKSDGAFVFESVPLAPDMETDFVLTVTGPAGGEIGQHKFSVTQTAQATGGVDVVQIRNVLSRPLSILFVDGLHNVAPERTPLPYETILRAETGDTSGQIRIAIQEENNPLGEIILSDIPHTLPIGSAIEIRLTIQENYQIRARAFVPALAREGTAVIDIPIPAQKSLEELRSDLELLNMRADHALASASKGALFGDTKTMRLRERLKAAFDMLRSRIPEPMAIQGCLEEIDSLTRDIGSGWRPEPPRQVFQVKADEAEELLVHAIKAKPAASKDGYENQLQAIRAEAEKAYRDQNPAAWKDSYNKIVRLCDRLDDIIASARGTDEPARPLDPAVTLLSVERDLAALETRAQSMGLHDKFRGEFQSVADELKRIDPKAQDAMNQIRDWYSTRYADLRRRIEHGDDEDKRGLPAQAVQRAK